MINQVPQQEGAMVRPDLDQLFRLHFAEICRRTYYLTGNRAVAEELAQEAFIRLWERPPSQAGNLSG